MFNIVNHTLGGIVSMTFYSTKITGNILFEEET